MKTCRICNHLFSDHIEVDQLGKKVCAVLLNVNTGLLCPCNKQIDTNLEYLEYKYEQSNK